MKVVIYDIETNGLIKDKNLPITEVDNFPRIIQFGWILCDMSGNEFSRHKHLIKPAGWFIPTDNAWWKDHGFTQEKNFAEGVDIVFVLDLFLSDLMKADAIVSHNMKFDHPVVCAEMIRADKRHNGAKLFQVCTKEHGEALCKLPFANERRKVPHWKKRNDRKYRWPSLSELHNYLFKKDFENAHDALADVIACRDCFFEMVKRGVIELKEETVTT